MTSTAGKTGTPDKKETVDTYNKSPGEIEYEGNIELSNVRS